jgi:hypothetical protein
VPPQLEWPRNGGGFGQPACCRGDPKHPKGAAMNLQTRVMNILTKPKEEWPVIAAETTGVAALYQNYIAILAAIPPIASFIGMTLIGVTVPILGTYRVGFAHGLTSTVLQYVLGLIGVYIAAFVIDKLAPTFQSESSTIQALKLVAYASTPAWVAGVLNIIPALGILGILGGLYGIYLFYLGVMPLMKTPSDKVIPYMVVSAIVVIIVMVVMSVVAGALAGAFFAGPRIMP